MLIFTMLQAKRWSRLQSAGNSQELPMGLTFPDSDHSLLSLSGLFTRRVSTSVRASVVAVLTAVDVVGRMLPTLVVRLYDTDLVPVAVSLLLSNFANSAVLQLVAPFLLYGYLVYKLIPRLFPNRLRHVTEQRGFCLIAVGYALLVPVFWLNDSPEMYGLLLISGLIVLPMYLVVVQRGKFLSKDGYPAAMASAFLGEKDLQEEWEEDPHVRNRTLLFWMIMILMILLSVVFSWFAFVFVGFLLASLSLVYPVPELLITGWVGQRALLRSPVGPDEKVLARHHLDLETRLLAVVSTALKGVKGFTSVVMAGIGFLSGVVFLFFAIALDGRFIEVAMQAPTFSLARLLLVVVFWTSLWVLGLYGVGYWVLMFYRIPAFLDAWRVGLRSKEETEPEHEERFPPTRPPGYFLPPTLLWLVYPALNVGTWESPQLPRAWAVLIWLAALALTVWTAYRVLVASSQPARTDQWALPGSFLVTVVGYGIWLDLAGSGLTYDVGSSYLFGLLTGRVSVDQVVEIFAAGGRAGTVLTILIVPLFFFWFEDVLAWWKSRDDWRGYVYVPYLLVAGAVVIVAALASDLGQRVGFAFAVAFLGVMLLMILSDVNVIDGKV